jgi:hypothetical protein
MSNARTLVIVNEKIAIRVIGTVIPTLIAGLTLSTLGILLSSPEQWTRHIPAGIAVVILLFSQWFVWRGHIRTAANLLIGMMCIALLTGLGLSISYFIVTEDHHGTLAVQSTPGTGTTFTICLPLNRRSAHV